MIRKSVLSLLIISSYGCSGLALNPANRSDTTNGIPGRPLRVYNTMRLAVEKPSIDGKLDDPCWKTGEWAGDFIQWIPKEGAPPSQPTHFKILYDDKNIYVAIRAVDHEPEKIIRKAGRRDELRGDVVGVNFDSYHDHRTGFEFNVTAAGQKIDQILTNPMNGDANWNAVWYAKTGAEDSAWTAEYEIPLSQLRYSGDSEEVWGMPIWRWIDRLQEESDWEPQSSTGPGMLYLFGELRGIQGLPKSRRLELMPYSLGKLKTFRREPGNPFADKGRSISGNAGMDAKIGLSNNFTADLTACPDFGQVESDPSVMNLTAFETFYEEKRPFFLEGKNIFNYDFDDASVFYSRRIGHTPGYRPRLEDHEYMDFPDNTTILSAAKISGKTANGLSLGVLHSLTAGERADLRSPDRDRRVAVEPSTHYFIARAQQDFQQGNSVLGGIFTSTNRLIGDPHLESMVRNAYTGGLDLLHQWSDKEFYVDAKWVGSAVTGSTDAVSKLQNEPARYFRRPDADHLRFDSTATGLTGHGGEIRIGKGSKGGWRYSTEINWRSPGLELNDLGYMQTADVIKQHNALSYFINRPAFIFRTYTLSLNQINDWDFGMRHLSSLGGLSAYLEFMNKWAVNTSFHYTSRALDTRILRGGPAMFVPPEWTADFYLRTDPSRRLVFDFDTDLSSSRYGSARSWSLEPGLSASPFNTLKISLGAEYSWNRDRLQYVGTESAGSGDKIILGKLDQRTLEATFRIDYNLTPEMSIQYYGSPFASAGRYSEFKTVADPVSREYAGRFSMIPPRLNGDGYEVTAAGDPETVYAFADPDFNFGQFRSNFVFRWEYRPGSQVYLVWSQDRTKFTRPGALSARGIMEDLKNVFADNIFLVKFNYWFSI